MANSITIKTLTQNMVTYANKNLWESYTLSLGILLRTIIDNFQS
jgi:hypothetical protein